MSEHGKKVVEISGLRHYLESYDEFSDSLYENVYKQAFSSVDSIIKEYYKINNGVIQKQLDNQLEVPNIITFIGPRGVGKTSAMLSFMLALKKYKGSFEDDSFYHFKDVNVRFTCLDCIDGSLMEHGEDIYKTILAQIYQKFTDVEVSDEIQKEADFDFKKRELLSELEELYRSVCDMDIAEKEQFMAGEAYINSLRGFSSSQQVRSDFTRLIKRFTDMMRYKRYKNSDHPDLHYVVIAIDDIDLNIQNSFSMLEKIHRYCTVPNMIVLMSLDIHQILTIVSRHYYDVSPRVDKILVEQEGYIRKLAVDYLEKIFPLNYRIYLPKLTQNPDIVLRKENDDIKHAILKKIYLKTGICFDSQGLKKHFYLPSSFRELTAFYLLLESMEEISKVIDKSEIKNESEIRKISKNYNDLLFDLENRLSVNKLISRQQIDFFDNLLQQDIFRAKNNVKQFLNNCIGIVSDYKNDIVNDNCNHSSICTIIRGDEEDVSYGELVETIYTLSRYQFGKYKQLVHCLLAFFSYKFSEQYYTNKSQNNTKIRFKGIFGENIVSLWADDLLPRISTILPDRLEIMEYNLVNFKDGFQKSMGRILQVNLNSVFFVNMKHTVRSGVTSISLKEIVDKIVQIEFMLMFFTNFRLVKRNEEGAIIWEFTVSDDKVRNPKGEECRIYLSSFIPGAGTPLADFNILNPILNSMGAYEELKEVEIKLIEEIYSYLSKKKNKIKIILDRYKSVNNTDIENKDSFKELLDKELANRSLVNRYKSWEEKYEGYSMPLPLWWFDYSYNILKRLRYKMKKEIPHLVTTESSLCDYTATLYKAIAKLIEDQDGFYNTKIEEKYKDCPIIDILLNLKKDEENERTFKTVMEKMFRDLKNLTNTVITDKVK